jgi:dephospho-CoA kinase
MAFDVVPYGDVTAQEVIDAIAKVAPTVCSDVVVQETYTDDSEKAQALRDLVGQEFTYKLKDLYITDPVQQIKEAAPEAVEAETL